MQTVYIDLYFMINFAMDFLCFYLLSHLLSTGGRLWRVLLASAFGALYACFALVIGLGGVWSILADIASCICMCAIAYYRRGEARALAVNALVYSALSILLGGAMTALFYFFNRIGLDRLLGSEEDADGLSVWLFALIAVIGGIGASFGGRLLGKRATRRACQIIIGLYGNTVTLDGICDSGNLLREPISALPCIIIEEKALSFLIGERNARFVAEGRAGELPLELSRRIRAVPTKTVNTESISYAIRPDSVRLCFGKEKRSAEAYIVLSRERIRAEGASALVPTELFI